MKKTISLILFIILILSLTVICFAHQGRTDGNGGHYDHSTGKYHYHHGYPAHQHEDGKCPYKREKETQKAESTESNEISKFTDNSSTNNTNSVTRSNSGVQFKKVLNKIMIAIGMLMTCAMPSIWISSLILSPFKRKHNINTAFTIIAILIDVAMTTVVVILN